MIDDTTPDHLEIIPLGDEGAAPVTLAPGAPATVGRSGDCRFVVRSDAVSRRHAEVAWSSGGWSVVDLGSRNGTQVNGWKIEPDLPVLLHDGDVLTFGSSRFQVKVRPETAAPPKRHAPETYLTHASIFERLREADPAARELGWEEFRRRYAPVVTGYCRNAGLSSADAEDVLQEIMLGFFRAAEGFRYDPRKGRFRGYLKRSVHNAIRQLARRSVPMRNVTETYIDARVAQSDAAWETRWDEQILARAVEEVRGRVDPRTFEAFELYGRRGVPVEEVARQTGLSPESVYQAKTRVMRLIQSVVDQIHKEEG